MRRLLPSLTAALLVAVATLATFWGVLEADFVSWDDYDTLSYNSRYRGFDADRLRWMFTTFHMGHYQPLSWLSFAVDHHFWGMDPRGYHLTSLLLHSANAVLVFAIASLLFGRLGERERLWGAVLAALLFSLHPMRVESVAWVTERRDVLSGFWLLVAVYSYLRAWVPERPPRQRWPWLVVCGVAFVLCTLARAIGMVLPVLLIALDFYPLGRLAGQARGRWRVLAEKLPLFAISGLAAVAAVRAQHSTRALLTLEQHDLAERIAQASYGLAFYVWKTLIPLDLSPHYLLGLEFDPLAPAFVASYVALLGALMAITLRLRSWPWLALAAFWYAVLLAPVLGVAQSGNQLVADRYSYLSCLGWAVLAGAGAAGLAARRSSVARWVWPMSLALGLGLVATLAGLTRDQVEVWRSSRALWSHVLDLDVENPIAHVNYGNTLGEPDTLDRAIHHYREALRLAPETPLAHYNLGRVLLEQGRFVEAVEALEAAVAQDPYDAESSNKLGVVLLDLGQTGPAVDSLEEAVRRDPGFWPARFNLGRALRQHGLLEDALRQFEIAVRLEPTSVDARVGLAAALLKLDADERARTQLEEALRLDPAHARAHLNLGRVLLREGLRERAFEHFREAVRISPGLADRLPAELRREL